jgi:hypothetical protein
VKDPTVTGLLQPSWAALMNPYTSAVIPAVEASAPARSNRPGWRSDSVMYSGASAASSTPMGTFTNSTQRHDSHEVRIPPASRPMAPPATATAENTPNARLRSRPSGKLVLIKASAVGAAMAAPTPWRARAASSQPEDVASPPRNEARVNTTIPAMNTRRRPRMSPARPPSSSRPPKVRV